MKNLTTIKTELLDEWVLENLEPILNIINSNYLGTNIISKEQRIINKLKKVDDLPQKEMQEFKNQLNLLGLSNLIQYIRS